MRFIIDDMTLVNDALTDDDTMRGAKDLCVRSMHLMADGTLDQFEEIVHPEACNRESKDEPPETRGRGPEAFYATALWLRGAFDELAFEIHDVVAEGDLVVVHNTMSGRHTGVFTIYGPNGEVTQAMPPTGQAVRHDADALDAGQGRQGDRALGQPRRPGHGDAAGVGPAVAVVPGQDGARHPPGPQRAARRHTRVG